MQLGIDRHHRSAGEPDPEHRFEIGWMVLGKNRHPVARLDPVTFREPGADAARGSGKAAVIGAHLASQIQRRIVWVHPCTAYQPFSQIHVPLPLA